MQKGARPVPSVAFPDRNESYTAGDVLQKPGPPSAMTITEPSYPTNLPIATVTSNPISEKWNTRFPASRRYPFSAETDTSASFSDLRSEEHTSELQSLMRISDAVFC